ncbi:hypothetical protein E8E12_008219 [Didymella heteroderae]|uniref:Uncharacterized protein n=1 Tax=Didymella heteroderae TaxID=1769908 RepID=A0A9P4WPP2_9PLEO|nr:hypothetical protein E8E12_008219 [Didymella heteroderae]
MSLKNKLIVIIAFWLRIPTLVFTILRNETTNDLISTTDVSLTAAIVVIWQSIEMSYSIAAATIAALKRFTESLNTGFGHGGLIRVHGHSKSYKLSDLSASLKDSKIKPTTNTEPLPALTIRLDASPATRNANDSQSLKLRPESIHNEATVSSQLQSSGSRETSMHDQPLRHNNIRQDVRYSVHYDEHPPVSVHNL